MKKGRIGMIVLGLALSPAFTSAAFGQQPVKFGVIADITGPASSLGVPERDTALMLQAEISAKGGIKGRPVRLVISDGESDETKTLLAAKKAIEEERVAALICCTQSGTSLAIKNAVQSAKVRRSPWPPASASWSRSRTASRSSRRPRAIN